jgi:glutamate dehydrogenase/leucine dehydrogenase
MTKTATALENALAQLTEAAAIVGLEPHVHELLKRPMRELTVRIPLKMDNGTVRIIEAYRFQHNWANGPIRGGTRFHKDETPDDVRALSMWMTIKNACNNIPNGGGKGGIAVDPATLSVNELERLCRAYIRAISSITGPWMDFPGADIGTDARTQSWMLDEWEAMHQRLEPAAVSGKAMPLGGSAGRALATSRGLQYATRAVASSVGKPISSLRAVVQGFGKVGGNLVKLYEEDKVTVCGVSDIHGGIYNADGLDLSDVFAWFEEKGSLKDYPKAKAVSNAELLVQDCDILAPCAVQSVITPENAGGIKAWAIIEGANGPVTVDAEKILLERKIIDCPDVYANSGGTQVAHFERIQNLNNDSWTEEYVNKKLEDVFIEVFNEVYTMSQTKGITMRMSCWAKALNHTVSSMKWRGWI